MNDQVKAIYLQAKEVHNSMYGQLKGLEPVLKKNNDMHDLANYVYALREAYRFIDDLRKELNNSKELAERIACLLWTKDSKGDPIRTPYCTGTPKVRMMASIPKESTKPELYAALMEFLGIPPESRAVVRPHWPSFVDWLSNRLEDGKALPPGIDPKKTYPVYTLTIRAKQDIED